MHLRSLLTIGSTLATTAVLFGSTAVTSAQSTDTPKADSTKTCFDRRGDHRRLDFVVLTADGMLACGREDRPERAQVVSAISGLSGDRSLVGIDFRPANKTLYGLGNSGGIYSINLATGVATLVSRASEPLRGTSFDIDFNPTVDRLRVVSDAGQNLRIVIETGATTVDTPLNIPGAPPTNPALGISAAAYTNNDADPNTGTTLFDIDTSTDQLMIQAPPNAGSLNPTGKLRIDAVGDVGFDIHTGVSTGVVPDSRGLAVIGTNGRSELFEIALLSGEAIPKGTFTLRAIDIAIPLS
jgi:hypothetical protein